MKKLSFLLMAMLFSVMSFAQEAIYTLDGTITGGSNGYADASSLTQGNIAWSVTGNTTMSPWRIGGKTITNQDRAVYSKNPLAYNIDKIELTHGTANSITVNSLKLIISDAANGAGETIDVTFKASATTTIDLPEGDYSNKYFKFLYNVTVSDSKNKFVEFKSAKFYAALAEDAVKAPVITGAEDFVSETEVTIEAEDDVTVYYTLDGTEPTTASTVYAAPFTVKETTTVKAVAYRGETASFVTSATFTQATRVTAAEAAQLAMKVASNNALTSVTYVIDAYVTSVIDQTLSSGQQRFWVADTKDGGQVLQSYYCNVPQVLKVGDYIQMFGKLTKYNTSPQMKNGDVTILPEPVVSYVVTVSANPAEAGTVAGGGEFDENEEITVTATAAEGYEFVNWTVDGEEVSTDAEYTFSVTADLALVANFKEVVAEPEYMVVEDKITNFVFDMESWPMVCKGGPSADYGVEVYLVLTEAADGTLSYEDCSVSIKGTDATFIDGTLANLDPYAPYADAVLHVQWGEEYYELQLAMSGAVAEPYVVEVENATVEVTEYETGFDGATAHELKVTADWVNEAEELTYAVEVLVTEFDPTAAVADYSANLYVTGDGEAFGMAEGIKVTVAVDGNKLTVSGEGVKAFNGNVYNLSLSGNLPVEEPAGVTYNVTVPEGTYACYIAGEMNEWTHQEMNKVDDTHYTITIEGATTAMKYKYCSGPEWKYVEKDANGNDVLDRTYAENDVVASWAAIYNPNPTVEPETTWTVAGSVIFGSEWTPADAANDMTLQNDGTYKWEKIGLELAANTKIEFKVVKNHAWGEEYPSSNYVLTIAEDGIYTVTITFNPSTKDVVALVTKTGDADVEVEISYVLMGVQGDWEAGIALTQNPENANEYILLGQEILKGDAVKVVTMTNGKKTAYCGNVEEWTQVAYDFDADGNIVLKPGKYDFYYKVDGDIIYIGGEAYPEVIAYELDGGVLPTVTVPTQEELWNSFKTAAGLTGLGTLVEIIEAGAGKPHNDQNNPCACRIICAKLLDANVNAVFALPEWAWLKAYIMTVQSGLPEASNASWRYAFAAFFLQSEHSAYPASADFTEAGKPEVWGAAYQAANELVLPTEPVAEDYVLPTPTKEGYKFVGWYDNAAGEGEAYEVIPAGWSGTLYAIWEQDTTTALENIAVEGKAVKAIINGQLIIIKNGVQYNAQGQVVK